MTAIKQKKRLEASQRAESKPMTHNDPAREALRAFLRRVFSQLANTAQADSLAFRKVLEGLK